MAADWVQVDDENDKPPPSSKMTTLPLLQHLVWCSEHTKITVESGTMVIVGETPDRLRAFQVRQPPLPNKKKTTLLNASAIEEFVCRLFRRPGGVTPEQVEELRREAVMPAFRAAVADASGDACPAPIGAVFHVTLQSAVEINGLIWLKTQRVTSCSRIYHAWILVSALVPWTGDDEGLVRVAVPFIEPSGVVWDYLLRTVMCGAIEQ